MAKAAKDKTKEELLKDNAELFTALSMMLSTTSNREAINAVEYAKAVLNKLNGKHKTVDS